MKGCKTLVTKLLTSIHASAQAGAHALRLNLEQFGLKALLARILQPKESSVSFEVEWQRPHPWWWFWIWWRRERYDKGGRRGGEIMMWYYPLTIAEVDMIYEKGGSGGSQREQFCPVWENGSRWSEEKAGGFSSWWSSWSWSWYWSCSWRCLKGRPLCSRCGAVE